MTKLLASVIVSFLFTYFINDFILRSFGLKGETRKIACIIIFLISVILIQALIMPKVIIWGF